MAFPCDHSLLRVVDRPEEYDVAAGSGKLILSLPSQVHMQVLVVEEDVLIIELPLPQLGYLSLLVESEHGLVAYDSRVPDVD